MARPRPWARAYRRPRRRRPTGGPGAPWGRRSVPYSGPPAPEGGKARDGEQGHGHARRLLVVDHDAEGVPEDNPTLVETYLAMKAHGEEVVDEHGRPAAEGAPGACWRMEE